MSFLDEVDSLEEKLQIKKVSPVVLVGIVAIALVVLFLIMQAVVGSLTSDSFSLASTDEVTAESVSEDSNSNGTSVDTDQVVEPDIVVYVTGEVKEPGVYTLPSGSRINDAVEAAGGVTKSAVLDDLNLAELLSDGMQITVPDKKSSGSQQSTNSSSDSDTSTNSSSGTGTGKVNINTATVEELQTLKGIGPALSQRIVDYREANGKFSKIEDLKNVSGIGDKTYESLSSDICV